MCVCVRERVCARLPVLVFGRRHAALTSREWRPLFVRMRAMQAELFPCETPPEVRWWQRVWVWQQREGGRREGGRREGGRRAVDEKSRCCVCGRVFMLRIASSDIGHSPLDLLVSFSVCFSLALCVCLSGAVFAGSRSLRSMLSIARPGISGRGIGPRTNQTKSTGLKTPFCPKPETPTPRILNPEPNYLTPHTPTAEAANRNTCRLLIHDRAMRADICSTRHGYLGTSVTHGADSKLLGYLTFLYLQTIARCQSPHEALRAHDAQALCISLPAPRPHHVQHYNTHTAGGPMSCSPLSAFECHETSLCEYSRPLIAQRYANTVGL